MTKLRVQKIKEVFVTLIVFGMLATIFGWLINILLFSLFETPINIVNVISCCAPFWSPTLVIVAACLAEVRERYVDDYKVCTFAFGSAFATLFLTFMLRM